jgi:hypothetical protein
MKEKEEKTLPLEKLLQLEVLRFEDSSDTAVDMVSSESAY